MKADKIKEILLKKLKFTHQDIEKLNKFHDELLKYNKKYNLISKSTEDEIWSRHILDSAQIVNFIDFKQSYSLSDLGTGAGFPGIVLAIFNKNNKFHVKLYEKSKVKCNFIKKIKTRLRHLLDFVSSCFLSQNMVSCALIVRNSCKSLLKSY